MTQETGNFRGKLFGGFDRQDVIDYIESLASERNSLQNENEELRDKISELEDKLYELESAVAREKNTAVFEEQQPDESSCAADEREAKCASLIAETRAVISDIRAKYDAICADIKINVTQAECDFSRISDHATGIAEALESAGQRLAGLSDSLDSVKDETSDCEEEN